MILVVAALKEELGKEFTGVQTVITGVGKVNATYWVTKAIAQYKPTGIINLGTAGSLALPVGSMVECRKFVQADMNCQAIGTQAFVTPFEQGVSHNYLAIKHTKLPDVACATADTFVQLNMDSARSFDGSPVVYDMEAYAIAKVCLLEKISFCCIKYISDCCDARQWDLNKELPAKRFRVIYDDLMAKR